MPQVVLFIDGEKIAQKGMLAPKKAHKIEHWRRDCLRLFEHNLKQNSIDPAKLVLDDEKVETTSIRLGYIVTRFGYPEPVGFYIDRKANWAA